MRKCLMTLIATAGLMGFASIAQADCGHDQVVKSEQSVVVTETTPIVKPDLGG